jgi:hypothetical protein
VRWTASQTSRCFLASFTLSGNRGWAAGIDDSIANKVKWYSYHAAGDIQGGVQAATGSYIVMSRFGGGGKLVRVNGVDGGSATGLAAADYAGVSSAFVGSLVSGVQPFAGHVAEVILYDSALSAPDVSAVESYLNSRYAIF